ncbi:hypothetical protein [Lysinibacillus sp. TE18511]
MFLYLRIETERLVIRPYALFDLDELYAVISEPVFHRFIPEENSSVPIWAGFTDVDE